MVVVMTAVMAMMMIVVVVVDPSDTGTAIDYPSLVHSDSYIQSYGGS